MADILHRFTVRATAEQVFDMFAEPGGLNEWWTLTAQGMPKLSSEYEFGFGPDCRWRGVVTGCVPNEWLEWRMTTADTDWTDTRVGVRLAAAEGGRTAVDFYHADWREQNEHFRVSSMCWAMYLRILRRRLEHGELIPYHQRDSV